MEEARQALKQRCSGISAGIFAAAPGNFGEAAAQLESYGGNVVHFDVMDGGFVPQMTGGPAFLAVARKNQLRDVHLMTQHPARHVEAFASAGADIISVHAESGEAPSAMAIIRAFEQEKGRPIMTGLAVMPGTAVDDLDDLLALVPDLVLVLAVDPRSGFQADIASACVRLDAVRNKAQPGTIMAIDGGISEKTIAKAVMCHPDLVVSGSAIFGSADPKSAFEALNRAWASSVGGGYAA